MLGLSAGCCAVEVTVDLLMLLLETQADGEVWVVQGGCPLQVDRSTTVHLVVRSEVMSSHPR